MVWARKWCFGILTYKGVVHGRRWDLVCETHKKREEGLIAWAERTCSSDGEELLCILLSVSLETFLRRMNLKIFLLLLFSIAEYSWPWIKCAVGTDGNSSLM